jgi:FkbM family methyltransferase
MFFNIHIITMSSTDQTLQRCFEKHPFDELNSLDYDMLRRAMNLFATHFPSSLSGVFFDVGCNAGSFVRVMHDVGITGAVHCFEPHPVLSKKVAGLYPHIKMNPFCLGSINGTVDIHIPMHSVGLSSIIKRPVFDTLNQGIVVMNVKCQTVDSYCIENSISEIDFIKIDVEGAEKHIFDGAKGMLASRSVKAGIFEVGQTLTDAGTSGEEICALLENYGYTIVKNVSNDDYYFHK